MIDFQELKDFLDQKADQFQTPEFIDKDPLQIPHRFSLLQDIEIAGFLTASIAWGNRTAILGSANRMMALMGESPYDFVMNFRKNDLRSLEGKAVHRTFSALDFEQFLLNLQRLYKTSESLEAYFTPLEGESDLYHGLERFRTAFILDFSHRSSKHVSSTYKNSAAKRLMMYLRWMVRSNRKGVDFGLWTQIDPAKLSIPLDVHTANISRKLGLLERRQNDWKSVKELDLTLRKMDPVDPAKYDFALFGLGVTKEI